MRRFIEVAVVVLVIIQNANSIPQFGQSFASSSITDSSGKVLSKSVYTDSTGKKIINGVPQLEIDLLPPLLPNQIPGLDLPVSPPFNKPVISIPSVEVEPPLLPNREQDLTPKAVATTTTTTTTQRPTTTTTTTLRTTQKTFAAPKFQTIQQRPVVNNFIQRNGNDKERAYKNGNDGAYRVKGDDGSYRLKGSDDGSYRVKGNDGQYRPKGNLGFYVHNNAGTYVQDDRGKYRAI